MPTKSTIRQSRYDAEHCVRVALKLNSNIDADILAQLSKQESKQGYIKALIRADIAKSVLSDAK